MKIKECMTRDVRTISPDRTIQEAASVMAAMDTGVLPVGENDRLIGMITDRDISVRAVAKGMNCDTPVRQVMSEKVRYCFEDDDIDEVAENMSELQVRRLPVVNRDKRLVGIIALGDMARGKTDEKVVGATLQGISRSDGARAPA